MATSDQQGGQVHLTTEQPAQSGPIKWDYRVGWLAVSLLIGIGGLFIIKSAAGSASLGLGWLILTILIYALFVYMPVDGESKSVLTYAAAKAVRETYDLAGWNEFNDEAAGRGDAFEISTAKPIDQKPRKVAKLIGRIEINAVGEGSGDTMPAVTHDRRLGTRSTTIWVNGTSLTSLDMDGVASRLEALANGIDSANPVATAITRLTWRTQTLLREPIDEDLLRQVVGRPTQAVPSIGVLSDVVAELSEASPSHLSTMTLTLDDKSIRRRKNSLASPEEILIDEMEIFVNGLRKQHRTLTSASLLSYNQTIGVTRSLVDPVYVERMNPGLLQPSGDGSVWDPRLALPGYYNFGDSRDMARAGNTYHKFYYVGTLDMTPVSVEDFTALQLVRVPKTVTNVVQVLARKKAIRQARFSANAAFSGTADRASSGARLTSSHRLLAEQTEEAEATIVKGKHLFARERIFVDVTGGSVGECLAHDILLHTAVGQTNLALHPMIDRHAEGVRSLLPIGAGLDELELSDFI